MVKKFYCDCCGNLYLARMLKCLEGIVLCKGCQARCGETRTAPRLDWFRSLYLD